MQIRTYDFQTHTPHAPLRIANAFASAAFGGQAAYLISWRFSDQAGYLGIAATEQEFCLRCTVDEDGLALRFKIDSPVSPDGIAHLVEQYGAMVKGHN